MLVACTLESYHWDEGGGGDVGHFLPTRSPPPLPKNGEYSQQSNKPVLQKLETKVITIRRGSHRAAWLCLTFVIPQLKQASKPQQEFVPLSSVSGAFISILKNRVESHLCDFIVFQYKPKLGRLPPAYEIGF